MAVRAQQSCARQVDLPDSSYPIESGITNRCRIVEPGILIAGCFERLLRVPQLSILLFELRLVLPQLCDSKSITGFVHGR